MKRRRRRERRSWKGKGRMRWRRSGEINGSWRRRKERNDVRKQMKIKATS